MQESHNKDPTISWPIEGRQSISSTNIIHKRPAQYLAELIMINGDITLKNENEFWKNTPYKERYRSLVVRLSQRLKYCEYKHIYSIIVKNNLTTFGSQEIDDLIIQEIQNEVDI